MGPLGPDGGAPPAGLVRHAAALRELDPVALHAILRLRVDVFVVEQACPYPDLDVRDVEPTTRHVWLAPDGRRAEPACVLRVLAEPDGATTRIGRIATAPAWRGRRLAGWLIRSVLDELPPGRPSVLDAQAHLQAMYEGLGFAVDGPGFVEDGIPHVPMRRPG